MCGESGREGERKVVVGMGVVETLASAPGSDVETKH